MIIKETGKISKDFYVLGSRTVPVYLVDGPDPVLVDAGMTALAHHYERDIKEILGDRKPVYLFLTHSHFDHIGAVSHFKSIWPDLRVGGSARCQEILLKQKAIQLMRKLNLEALKSHKRMGISNLNEQPFESFSLDFLVRPESETELPCNIKAISTPGHTWDFLSYWIFKRKILIASEAVACYEADENVQVEFLVDFDTYLESLKAIKTLDAIVLCPGHHVVFTDQDVALHIQASFKAADKYLTKAEQFLNEEKGDIDRTVSRIKAWQWDDRPWPKQPESAYLLNTRQRVKTIWQRMNRL